jgi:Family of unknown function (DUF6325)
MPMGPVEVLVVAFPENQFKGEILPELQRLVEAKTISIIDGVLAVKDSVGDCLFVEFSELDASHEARAFAGLLDSVLGLISDEDVMELTDSLEPNSSAAILVFEHTWAVPLRDAIVGAGGVLAADFRVPGPVVDEVLAAVEAAN